MAGIPYAIGATQGDADETKSHFLAYTTARVTPGSLLFDIWNAATNAGRKFTVDLDGKPYSAAWTAGDVLYAVAGSVTGVKRLDSLAIGAANTVMTSSGTAPQWVTTLAGLTSVTSTAFVGALTGNASGSSGSCTGNAATATLAATATAVAASGITGTTLPAAIVASSLTSVGTLTALQVDNININLNTISTTAGDLTLAPTTGDTYVTGALIATTLAGSITTAAQTNITSLGTLTALTCSGDPIITGAAGGNRELLFATGATKRWGVDADGTAESGANAGSNFAIRAYDDAGTILGTYFSIVRSTNAGTFGGQLTVTGHTVMNANLYHNGTNVGFYGTVPIAKQTGVAATEAAIHAALVALGLIAA